MTQMNNVKKPKYVLLLVPVLNALEKVYMWPKFEILTPYVS